MALFCLQNISGRRADARRGFVMFLIMHIFLQQAFSSLNVSGLLPSGSNKICIFLSALGLFSLYLRSSGFEWWNRWDLVYSPLLECNPWMGISVFCACSALSVDETGICWLKWLWNWCVTFELFVIYHTSIGSAYLTVRVDLGLVRFLRLLRRHNLICSRLRVPWETSHC